jgi:hypothetical protein
MPRPRGAEAYRNPRAEVGQVLLSLVAGILLALLGWTAARRLHATSLEQLVFERGALPPRWTVALVFRPKECPSRMELVDRLNRLSGSRLQVQGILVVGPGEFTDWHDLVTANQITFPVRTASPEAARGALGGTPTPALLVYDPQGRLRLLTDLADARLTNDILTQVSTLTTRSLREDGS